MGLLNVLFGRTSPGKMAAAMNALVAKHMMQHMLALADEEDNRTECVHGMCDSMMMVLMKNGMGEANAKATVKGLVNKDADLYCMLSVTFNELGMDPSLPKCFPHGKWNYISNPLLAMRDTDEEVRLARVDIYRRYQIDILPFES